MNEKILKIKESMRCEIPFLTDVLMWQTLDGRDKYSHFEASKGKAYFCIYDSDDNFKIEWDLSCVALVNQSKELIDFLYELTFI